MFSAEVASKFNIKKDTAKYFYKSREKIKQHRDRRMRIREPDHPLLEKDLIEFIKLARSLKSERTKRIASVVAESKNRNLDTGILAKLIDDLRVNRELEREVALSKRSCSVKDYFCSKK